MANMTDVSVKFRDGVKSFSTLIGTLDIETGSLDRANGYIFTLGITIGDIMTGAIVDQLYLRVKSTEDNYGRIFDEDTMDGFWYDDTKTDKAARDEIFNQELERYPLKEVLEKLNDFVGLYPGVSVFGNGNDFDNVMVEMAMDRYNITPKWRFWQNQSMRTCMWLVRLILRKDVKYSEPFNGIKHHALHDSEHEFKVIHHSFRELRNAVMDNSNVG